MQQRAAWAARVVSELPELPDFLSPLSFFSSFGFLASVHLFFRSSTGLGSCCITLFGAYSQKSGVRCQNFSWSSPRMFFSALASIWRMRSALTP